MKISTTKNALLMSILSLFLCFAMLIGTTFAWFTDTVESATNTIVAGNLDVELDYWNGTKYTTVEGATELFDPNALWEPGHAEVVYLKISNKGSLALKYLFAVNVLGETVGKTEKGEDIQLSEHLQFGIVPDVAAGAYGTDRAAAIAAVTNPQPLTEAISNQHLFASMASTDPMLPNTEKTLAVVVWMPTGVGNEANHDGVNVPSIFLGMNVVATQVQNESDSFGPEYDKDAELPVIGTGMAQVIDGIVSHSVEIRDTEGKKLGSAEIPAEAVADAATHVGFKVEEIGVNPNVTVAVGNEARTFDVTPIGLKDNNTASVKVNILIDTGLDPATVVIYHYETVIPSTYNPTSGYVTFETATFSPFTVVYDAESEYEAPSVDGVEAPTANIVYLPQFVGADKITTDSSNEELIYWNNWGGLYPTEGLDAYLDAAFSFEATQSLEDAKESPYAYWNADFVVSLDRELEADQIFLGGNYGGFGWVGFHYAGDVETIPANTEIPLLGTFSQREDGLSGWTYVDVVNAVGKFMCGVGDHNASLEGAKFTVILRITNPEDTTETVDVATVVYTFGGSYTVDGETHVSTGEQIQDAVNNGDEHIVLDGDIDLSQGIVIPGN